MTDKDLEYKPEGTEKAKFEYISLGKGFGKVLRENNKKEGLLKRLTNIEGKNEKQLKETEYQGERQLNIIDKPRKMLLDAIKKQRKSLKKIKTKKKQLTKKIGRKIRRDNVAKTQFK